MRKVLLPTVFAVTGWRNRCARPRGRIDCTISIGRPLLAVRSADHVPKKYQVQLCIPVVSVRCAASAHRQRIVLTGNEYRYRTQAERRSAVRDRYSRCGCRWVP
jgi:hypothetical protein